MHKKIKILTIIAIATISFSNITTNAMKRNNNNKTHSIKKEEKKSQNKENLEKQQLEQDKKEIEKNTKEFIKNTNLKQNSNNNEKDVEQTEEKKENNDYKIWGSPLKYNIIRATNCILKEINDNIKLEALPIIKNKLYYNFDILDNENKFSRIPIWKIREYIREYIRYLQNYKLQNYKINKKQSTKSKNPDKRLEEIDVIITNLENIIKQIPEKINDETNK